VVLGQDPALRRTAVFAKDSRESEGRTMESEDGAATRAMQEIGGKWLRVVFGCLDPINRTPAQIATAVKGYPVSAVSRFDRWKSKRLTSPFAR
jgi:hypothetical protein